MIDIEKRINVLITFGGVLNEISDKLSLSADTEFSKVIDRAGNENQWFTKQSILKALKNWSFVLSSEEVNRWAELYKSGLQQNKSAKNVAVINAGNIPFVGLHDMLSVFLSGHKYIGKNATGDDVLLPYVASLLKAIEPGINESIHFVPKLEKMDAVIATGSNNSSRYFEYYFGKYPNIIRKNMNGVAVLDGNETSEELKNLGEDIFSYFGLGCRNVSKLYVPEKYNFNNFFESMYGFNEVMNHNKYMNNFDYNNSVFLLKQFPFLQNGFLIIREEKNIPSPISVLHYETYSDINTLIETLSVSEDKLQCITVKKESGVLNDKLNNLTIEFGMSQLPSLTDYADRADTMQFLIGL